MRPPSRVPGCACGGALQSTIVFQLDAPVHECLVAHTESRLGNREALDVADWMSVVALSTLSGRSGASPHLKSRNDRPQRPGLAFAHFDFGISGIVHDEHERAACSRPDFFYPAQVHQGGAMGSKETELR